MKKLRFLPLLLITILLLLPFCHAQDCLYEDSINIKYIKHGRTMTETIGFSINLQNGEAINTANFPLQVITETEVFVYLNGTAIPYSDGCLLPLHLGENSLKLVFRSASGTGEKLYTIRTTAYIPHGWAHDALSFCVEKNILTGDKNLDLQPEKTATRAELAAMLTRFLHLTATADLTGYHDVDPNAWYTAELSAAVGSGLMTGSGSSSMAPNSAVTRQQAFVILSRAFGLGGCYPEAMAGFADEKNTASWALPGVSAMVNAGYVSGSGGKLRPGETITRQELAQVLYKLVDSVAAKKEEIPATGTVLYTGADIPSRLALDGNLILSGLNGNEIDLTSLRVTGNVTVHSQGSVIRWGDSIGSLSVCGTANLRPADKAADLYLLSAGSAVLGGSSARIWTQAGVSMIESTASSLELYSGSLRLDSSHVDTLTVHTEGTQILGSGTVDVAIFKNKPGMVEAAVTDLQLQYDAGLKGVMLTQSEIPTATRETQTVTVSAAVSGVDEKAVYGVDGGVRTCKAIFSLNDSIISTQDVLLINGTVFSCDVPVSMINGASTTQTVLLRLEYGSQAVQENLTIKVDLRSIYYSEAETIRTINVEATALRDLTVYTTDRMTTPTGITLKKGDVVTYIRNHGSSYRIKTADGTIGYASAWGFQISDKVYYSDHQYSAGAREAFVNELHSYSSPTKYLIWLNLYTETISIFEGETGSWKLIKECRGSSGKNTTPTRVGVFHIYSRAHKWTFDNNYYYVTYPSLFDGGIAFHSRTYLTKGGGFLDSRLGMTISHGCVRIPDDMAKWIFDNCAPGGTTVVVY